MADNTDTSTLFDLSGQVAIVTGAARGNGRAIAEGLASVGVCVGMADILAEDLESACRAICDNGHQALAVTTDLCQPADLEALVECTIGAYGRVDILVNCAGIGAAQGFPGNPAYQASKGALQQLTRAMACDWAQYNIRVNNLCPGYCRTEMTRKSWSDPEIAAQRARRCFLNRWAEPTELVGPVIFLASRASSYVSGNDLFVDGGFAKTGITESG